MIKRFGSLYAGAVDLEDYGYEATPVNDRWLSDEHLATVFEKSEAIATLMDRTGYSTLWFAEHHFQREGYECIPNVLMLAVHLAHLTKNLSYGCGFNIAPMWHPVRLAEDYATADILTKGRVVFGVGRGYHTREVEVFGAPMQDQDANRELFEEQVEIVLKALNQRSFSHQGKHYTIPPRVPYRGYEVEEITLVPRPMYREVECYQPIVSACRARPRLHGPDGDEGDHGRRRGDRRCQRAGGARLAGEAGAARPRDRARRRPDHGPDGPHRRQPGAGRSAR